MHSDPLDWYSSRQLCLTSIDDTKLCRKGPIPLVLTQTVNQINRSALPDRKVIPKSETDRVQRTAALTQFEPSPPVEVSVKSGSSRRCPFEFDGC